MRGASQTGLAPHPLASMTWVQVGTKPAGVGQAQGKGPCQVKERGRLPGSVQAAVYVEDRSVDMAGVVLAEEQHCFGDIVRVCDPS
jgi:hypothetical protein